MPDDESNREYDNLGPDTEYHDRSMSDAEKFKADNAMYKTLAELGIGIIQIALSKMEKRNPSPSLTEDEREHPLKDVFEKRILMN